MSRGAVRFGLGLLLALGAMNAAIAQVADGPPIQDGPPPIQDGSPVALPTAEQLKLPGATWEKLKDLPPFTGSRWMPVGVPSDERAYLAKLGYPPLKSEYLQDAKTVVTAILSGAQEAPSRSCTLEGMPRLAWYPYPVQFLYGAANVMLLQHDVIRATTTVGLAHTPQDPNTLQQYSINGTAAGAWQGDTLVIDTIQVRDDKDTFYGVPNDPDLHVVESYRLLDRDTLEKAVTIEAPAYFTAPWTVRTKYRRTAEPDGSWATHFCLPEGTVKPATVKIPREQRSPAPANARFTPNIGWDQILSLPRFWGMGWEDEFNYTMKVVRVESIQIWPPLKPDYMAKAKDYVGRMQQGSTESKYGGCYPAGVPRQGWYVYPPVFFMRPGNSLLIDVGGETREVFMDGRPHPATLSLGDRGADSANAYLGHSIGWWEGDTLVVDTVGFAPENDLFYGVTNGGRMHVRERYRLIDPNRLEATFTVEDPERLAQPWTLVRTFPGSRTATGVMSAGPGGMRIQTWTCRPGDSREVVDNGQGDAHLNLEPPPKGQGLAPAK